jgi:hypothetical protein
MPAVLSTCLDNADYNVGTSTLTLVFDKWGTYEFYSVAQAVYDALIAAPSKGQYFNYSIRTAGYTYVRIV